MVKLTKNLYKLENLRNQVLCEFEFSYAYVDRVDCTRFVNGYLSVNIWQLATNKVNLIYPINVFELEIVQQYIDYLINY